MKHLIGFIGYGEAAYNISLGLASEGMKTMGAFDVMQNDIQRGEKIKSHAAEAGVELEPSLESLCKNSDFIISLTSPAICIEVAKQAFPFITSGQVFCDFNSADPTDMAIIDKLPRPEGVLFTDVAVLGSVPKTKHRTKMYMCGDGAKKFYEMFKQWNTVLKLIDAPAGGASAIKMFKSVFSKGLPQLFLETYVPAASYGVYEEILSLTKDTFKNTDIEKWCNENLFRTLIHAKRRSAEAEYCARTVERLGFDASMSKAVHHKLCMLADQNYKDKIGDKKPNRRETVEMVMQDLKGKK